LIDSLYVNDTCKRPISQQKHLYLVCQAGFFRDPKLYFATPNGVATHSLRSPGLQDVHIFNQNSIPAIKCEVRNLWCLGVFKFSNIITPIAPVVGNFK